MRSLSIIVAINLLTASCVISQNLSSIPHISHYPFHVTATLTDSLNLLDSTIFVPVTQRSTKQFALGPQWSFQPRIVARRLAHNVFQRGISLEDNPAWRPGDDTATTNWLTAMPKTGELIKMSLMFGEIVRDFRSMAIQFDPECDSTPRTLGSSYLTNPLDFAYSHDLWNPPEGESQGAAFGFSVKPTSAAYLMSNGAKYLILDSTVNASSSTALQVLANPTPDNCMYRDGERADATPVRRNWLRDANGRYTVANGSVVLSENFNRNGTRWFVTIKLRRLPSLNIAKDTTLDTNHVLRIRLPWRCNNLSTGYLNYATFPRVTNGRVVTHPDISRGVVDDSVVALTAAESRFVIRRNMLPKADSGDITLSAGFFSSANDPSVPPAIQNPFVNAEHSMRGVDSISANQIGIEVEFLNNASVAIDWIRIETPFARQTFRGYVDSAYAGRVYEQVEMLRRRRHEIDSVRTLLGDTTCGVADVRIWRFYGWDELDIDNNGHPFPYKKEHQYRSKLFDGMFHTEQGIQSNYIHCVPQFEYWGGPGVFTRGNLSPAIRRCFSSGDSNHYTPFGLRGGIDNRHRAGNKVNLDEIYWGNDYDIAGGGWIFPDNTQRGYANWSDNVNIGVDFELHRFFHRSPLKLYSNTPWWANIFVTGMMNVGENYRTGQRRFIFKEGTTAMLGEALREQHWLLIALGCKGFMADWGDPIHFWEPPYPDFVAEPTGYWHSRGYAFPDSIRWNAPAGANISASIGAVTGGWNYEFEGALASSANYATAPPIMIPSTYYSVLDRSYTKQRGTDFVLSNALGSDFISVTLDSVGNVLNSYDQTNIHRYIEWNYNIGTNPDTNVRTLGVAQNRFYFGRRSTRFEMLRMHDWLTGPVFCSHSSDTTVAKSAGDLLMRLRLKAWINNGNVFFSDCDGDTASISGQYDRFLWKDLSKWSVRHTGGCTKPDTLKYFLASIFAEVKKGTDTTLSSMDSVFYVAVVNKRQSPLVHPVGSSRLCDDRDTNLIFYSSFEFDSLAKAGVYNLYAQGGSREVAVPFNYSDMLGKSHIIHLKEVGDSVFSHPMLDTMMDGRGTLSVKLLPGEGRLFQVTVLAKTEESIQRGHLAFSNQRKIVGFNRFIRDTLGNIVKTDTIIYYAVYHKMAFPPTVASPARMAVFMRQSKPSKEKRDLDFIEWDSTEQVLSDELTFNADSNMRVPCMYPAITIRYDSIENQPKAFVVYTCCPGNTKYKEWNWYGDNVLPVYVCETTVPLLDGLGYLTSRRIIDTCYSNTQYSGDPVAAMTAFGHPMINASYTGNYYTWCDSLFGIVAAWKHPNDDTLVLPQHKLCLSWDQALRPDKEEPPSYGWAICKHPSLNTYSRIELGESDCALVWQEHKNSYDPKYRTYYSRLRLTNDTIRAFLSDTLRGVVVNTDSTIVRLSTNSFGSSLDCAEHTMPVVYRGVEVDLSGGRGLDTARSIAWDRIFWEADATDCSDLSPYFGNYSPVVMTRAVDLYQPSMLGSRLVGKNYSTVWHRYGGVYQPNTSQGTLWYKSTFDTVHYNDPNDSLSRNYTRYLNGSDSAIILNVIMSTTMTPKNAFTNVIYNLPHSRWTICANTDVNDLVFSSGYYAMALDDPGALPHLAARQSLTQEYSWRKNARIFESDTSEPPMITRSSQWLFKRPDVNQVVNTSVPLFGFSTRVSGEVISPILVDGIVNRLHIHKSSSVGQDTLMTDWIRIGDSTVLKFTDAGNGAYFDKFFIQRQSDGHEYTLNVANNMGRFRSRENVFRIRRGQNRMYRVIAVTPVSSEMMEQLMISEAQTNALAKHIEMEEPEIILSLGDNSEDKGLDVVVSPNPAYCNDILRFSFNDYSTTRGESCTYIFRLLDALGNEYKSAEVMNGATYSLDIHDLADGMYCIQVSEHPIGLNNILVKGSRVFVVLH